MYIRCIRVYNAFRVGIYWNIMMCNRETQFSLCTIQCEKQFFCGNLIHFGIVVSIQWKLLDAFTIHPSAPTTIALPVYSSHLINLLPLSCREEVQRCTMVAWNECGVVRRREKYDIVLLQFISVFTTGYYFFMSLYDGFHVKPIQTKHNTIKFVIFADVSVIYSYAFIKVQ